MCRSLRIAVADGDRATRESLKAVLTTMGHEVVADASNGRELVDACRDPRPEMILTEVALPGLDGIEAARQVARERPIPVILLTARPDAEVVRRAKAEHVSGFLVKPIKEADLGPAISMALCHFEEVRALHQEADGLRQALEDRKRIERAKGLLMKKTGLDEADAFRRLQKLASDRNLKLVQIAQVLLTAEEAYATK
ncbi:MAG: response regulator [Isosphaeraceae bacterium]